MGTFGTPFNQCGSTESQEFHITDEPAIAIVLRFRDMVTEVGETIAEHRKIFRQFGHVWWGWWYRQSEYVPRNVLEGMFAKTNSPSVQVLLFDSGSLDVYATRASRVVVAPSIVGINSPEYHATPEYYLRGRYPAWFRFGVDIMAVDVSSLRIIGKPTSGPNFDRIPEVTTQAENVSLSVLRDDRPTFWLSREIEQTRRMTLSRENETENSRSR